MKTFEEWFEQYCRECDRRLTAMDYINHTNHEWYFKTGWDARQPEIDSLKENITHLTYTYEAEIEQLKDENKKMQNCSNCFNSMRYIKRCEKNCPFYNKDKDIFWCHHWELQE